MTLAQSLDCSYNNLMDFKGRNPFPNGVGNEYHARNA